MNMKLRYGNLNVPRTYLSLKFENQKIEYHDFEKHVASKYRRKQSPKSSIFEKLKIQVIKKNNTLM